MSQALFFQLQSLLIFSLMTFGIFQKHNRLRHVKIMSLAILWDIILILQIELSRSAILKASNAMENRLILNIHVAFALASVLGYALMIYTGRKILKQQKSFQPRHKILGRVTYTLRFLTLVTSFWAQSPQNQKLITTAIF